jgi:hypothetical protein
MSTKKTKPIKIDDFDEDLDGKYYIKTNLTKYKTFQECFFMNV